MRNGVQVGTTGTSSPVPLPYAITHEDGEFQVVWTYAMEGQTYTRADEHKVVTPLFSQTELVDYDQIFTSLSSAQVVRLEKFIRLIVEAYTGQTFGFYSGTVNAYGDGSTVLSVDRRIISLDSPNDPTPYTNYRITASQYGVEALRGVNPNIGTYDPKTDTIYNPYAVGAGFHNNIRYTFSGKFGWTSVPTEVKEAALILAGEFSCNEATWRDRYIKSIRAADWRFDFDGRAFTGTGSASADLLLDKYRLVGAAVI